MSVEPRITVFLDTSILVYAYDRSAGQKHEIAAQLVRDCWDNENGSVSIQVLQEFYVIMTRKIAAPLDHPTGRQIVTDLTQWHVHIPHTIDLIQAIDLQHSYKFSFWDAMILQSAVRLGCKQLLSEDFSHGQAYGNVEVINPFKGTK